MSPLKTDSRLKKLALVYSKSPAHADTCAFYSQKSRCSLMQMLKQNCGSNFLERKKEADANNLDLQLIDENEWMLAANALVDEVLLILAVMANVSNG